MTISVPGFPNTFQTEYARIPEAPLPGDLWEGELFNERPIGGLIANVTEVAYGATVTIGAFNSGDEVGIIVNGVTIPVTAVTDASATAALLNTAINSASLLSGVISSTVVGAALTLTGALGVEITASEYSPDATTATFSAVTASVVQQQLDFGYGVVRDVPSLTVNRNAIKKPTASTDTFVGVLVRTRGGEIPATQKLAAGFDPDYLMPGMTYAVMRANAGVVVEYVGTAPTESDDVYLIYSGTNAGKWRVNDGSTSQVTQGDVESNYAAAVSQVTRGDVQFNGTDDVGLIVDGLDPLFVASNTDDDTTATDLRDAWNGDPAYAAIATASIDLSGAESYIILTFLDDQVHTVTAYSPATADITGITNTTAAVAAVADDVGLSVDSLPDLYVASITDDDTTAAALRDEWNASAQHAAVATASIDTSGATSLIVLTFLDDQAHTVTAYSPATADVTSITNTTTSVEATAMLIADYSWGLPSIPGSADLPARAFLRLSPS